MIPHAGADEPSAVGILKTRLLDLSPIAGGVAERNVDVQGNGRRLTSPSTTFLLHVHYGFAADDIAG
jgi:hypothetical protein